MLSKGRDQNKKNKMFRNLLSGLGSFWLFFYYYIISVWFHDNGCVDMGSLTCTTTLVFAVYTKAQQALRNQNERQLKRTEKVPHSAMTKESKPGHWIHSTISHQPPSAPVRIPLTTHNPHPWPVTVSTSHQTTKHLSEFHWPHTTHIHWPVTVSTSYINTCQNSTDHTQPTSTDLWQSPPATKPWNTCQNSTDHTQPTATDPRQSPPAVLTPVRIPLTTYNPHPLTCDSLHQHLPLGKLLLQVSNFSLVASISQCELCANMCAHGPVSHLIIRHVCLLQSCSGCSITPCA